MERRRVLLLGATGLIGSELLPLLIADDSIARVVTIARRTTGIRHAKLHEYLFDLAKLEQHADAFEGVDTIFCALGTTMKAAGSKEAFRFVDHDLPLIAARLGAKHGVRHYVLVSSLGADANARNFYTRVKGEVEAELQTIPYRTITIVRPSFLLGARKEFRLGERIVAALRFLFPSRVKPIEAQTVARALLALSKQMDPGTRIVESRELRSL
ncbi:MAG TPA: NAD(P)H-binding protein [Thermoanaerobaculia bacterium]|nr:NAD(P)H-binding protein [Thermoanaerobaculia bacterium]